ncbi:MAG: hypothetical protein SOY92_03325, partial [Prevotella sp.]|nr:hypothetical protein [Prevotella sp.]
LHLNNKNKLPFVLLNRIFALTFDKLGCISTIKINEFILYCLRFALPLCLVNSLITIEGLGIKVLKTGSTRRRARRKPAY